MNDQKQQQQQQQARPQPYLQSVVDKNIPPSKGEINGSSIPPDYHIFTKIDPPKVLAYYLERCLEDNIDPFVDPLNLPDDYPVVPLPPPPP